MNSSESLDKFIPAYIKMWAELEDLTKDTEGRFKYTDLKSAHDEIKPTMVEHGFAYCQGGASDDVASESGKLPITTRLMHVSSQWLESTLEMEIDPTSVQGNYSQAQGSVITYCRRYSLLMALGLTSFDDDAEQSGGEKSSKKKSPPSTPTPPKKNPPPTPPPPPPPVAVEGQQSLSLDRSGDYSQFQSNKWGGKCTYCEVEINPEEGYRANIDGTWVVFCQDKDACMGRTGEPIGLEDQVDDLPF